MYRKDKQEIFSENMIEEEKEGDDIFVEKNYEKTSQTKGIPNEF